MKKRTMILAGILSLTMVTPAFAGATHSYNVGTDLGDIDTTNEVLDVARNLVYAGYTPQIVTSNLGASTITNDWLNSGIVYLAGHGPTDGSAVLWINDDTNLNYRVCNYSVNSSLGRNVNNANLTDCKLAIMAACYSGLTGGIAQSFQTKGADCAIGWKLEVSDVTMARYNKILTSYLADGATVQYAIRGANADIVNEEDINYDPNVLQYKTYGSGVYNVVKRSTDVARSVDPESIIDGMDIFNGIDENAEGIYNPDTFIDVLTTYTEVKDCTLEYRNGNDEEIVSYIQKNVDPRFDKGLFEMTEIETIPGDDSDMIITYRYKVGDVVSDFGYNVNIENYKVVSYKEVGNKLYDYAMPTTIAVEDVKTEKLHTFKAEPANEADTVKEQNISVKFSSADKEYVYHVNTVYETEDGGVYCIRTKC